MKNLEKFILTLALNIVLVSNSCTKPREEYKNEHKKTAYELGAQVEDLLKSGDGANIALFFKGAENSKLRDPSNDFTPEDLIKEFSTFEVDKKEQFISMIDKNLLTTYYRKNKLNNMDFDLIICDLSSIISNDNYIKSLTPEYKTKTKNTFEILSSSIKSKL